MFGAPFPSQITPHASWLASVVMASKPTQIERVRPAIPKPLIFMRIVVYAIGRVAIAFVLCLFALNIEKT